MNTLIDKFKAYGEGSSEGLKRKQRFVIGLAFVAVGSFLWIAMSGAKTVSQLDHTKGRPKKIVVGDLIDEKATWVSRLEEKADRMSAQVARYQKENRLLSTRLENIESALLAQGKERETKEPPKPKRTVSQEGFNASTFSPSEPPMAQSANNTFPLGGDSGNFQKGYEPL